MKSLPGIPKVTLASLLMLAFVQPLAWSDDLLSSPPPPVSAAQLSSAETRKGKRVETTPSDVRISTGKSLLMSFSGDVLKVSSFDVLKLSSTDSKIIKTRRLTPRVVRIFGLSTGTSQLKVFVSRSAGDKVGKASTYFVHVEPWSEKRSTTAFAEASGSRSKAKEVNVTRGQVRLLSFPNNVIKVLSSDPKVINADTVTSRNVFVRGKTTGFSDLTVFLSRSQGDKVGKPSIYRIKVNETKASAQSKYHLKLLTVADASPEQILWQMDGMPGSVFKSLSSEILRQWVAKLPANSLIEWASSRLPMEGEPLRKEVQQFQEFCKEHGVQFIVQSAVSRAVHINRRPE